MKSDPAANEPIPETQVNTIRLQHLFSQSSPPPVQFINIILEECVNLAASDILFEPREEYLQVRVRIDGILYYLGKVNLEAYLQIATRIKVLCNLESTTKEGMQEGQFIVEHQGKIINLRVEITHIVDGELIVMRLHEKEKIVMDLAHLGFSETADKTYQAMLRQRSGLILVCGPTGSGKTTTLYSTVNKINEKQNYNVMTIEDPIEFRMPGMNQMNVHKDLTFAKGLRIILRLSPDIILVGEIRDAETAKIAVESGLTGQLVLSTIHAEDSIGALYRLLDLGIENYLLNSSLMGIVAQRLVRKVCQSCKTSVDLTFSEKEIIQSVLGVTAEKQMVGKGCSVCKEIGYEGRIGIFEVLLVDARVRHLIREKMNEEELRNALIKENFVTLLKDGLQKSLEGITTVNEVLRNSLRID